MATTTFPALDVKPVQQPDIFGQLGKVAALRNAMQTAQYQSQMQPIELQTAQNQLQQQQLALKSQQAWAKALQDNPAAPIDDVYNKAIQGGGDPAHLLPMMTQWKDYEIKNEQLRGDQLKNATTITDAQGQNAQMLLGIQDPVDRQQAWDTVTKPAMMKLGVDPRMIPAQVPDQATLQHFAAASMRTSDQLEQARKDQEQEQLHGVIQPARLQQLNAGMNDFLNLYGPQLAAAGVKASDFLLKPGATYDDYNRIDKLMEHTEKFAATQAQREQGMAIRSQTAAMANLASQERLFKAMEPDADEKRRYDMAGNLEHNLDDLQDIVTRRPELFGPGIKGGFTRLKQLWGSNDYDLGQLETLTHQIGMAQASAHSMKGAQTVDHAAQSILNDFKNGPQAVQGSIDAARKSVESFRSDVDDQRQGRVSGLTALMGPAGQKVAAAQQAGQQEIQARNQARALQGPPRQGETVKYDSQGRQAIYRGGQWVNPATGTSW